MVIDWLVDHVARDLRQGGGGWFALLAVTVTTILVSGTVAILQRPLDADLYLPVQTYTGRPGADKADAWAGSGQDSRLSDRKTTVECRDTGVASSGTGTGKMRLSFTMGKVPTCPCGQRPMARIKLKVSVWEFVRMKITGDASIPTTPAKMNADHAR